MINLFNCPITIYTDGACHVHGDHGGGWAYRILTDKNFQDNWGHVPDATSNRMELTAILKALENFLNGETLIIYTDSMNCIGWLQEGWKRKDLTIRALCDKIDNHIKSYKLKVVFKHIRGHKGHLHNEVVDRLAGYGADNRSPII